MLKYYTCWAVEQMNNLTVHELTNWNVEMITIKINSMLNFSTFNVSTCQHLCGGEGGIGRPLGPWSRSPGPNTTKSNSNSDDRLFNFSIFSFKYNLIYNLSACLNCQLFNCSIFSPEVWIFRQQLSISTFNAEEWESNVTPPEPLWTLWNEFVSAQLSAMAGHLLLHPGGGGISVL